MEKSICFYHRADYDGRCSAAIIKLYDPPVKVIGVDHPGLNVNFDDIDEETTVYIVDYSFSVGNLKLLKEISKKLVWIDHHTTAIESAKLAGFKTDGLLSVEKAACRLTWEYCFPKKLEPLSVKLIGKYDVWDHDRDTIPFTTGLSVEKDSYKPYKSEFWEDLFYNNNRVESILRKGRFLCSYNNIVNNQIANMCAFETTLDGHKAIAINKPYANSLLFDSVWDPKVHDMQILFYRHKSGIWKISLYNPDKTKTIHLGNIAAKYGGGGHTTAAGFQCETLPFKI